MNPPIRLFALFALLALAVPSRAADEMPVGSLNKPERLEWFRDQGFGLFIHWSVDSQLGVVISHSLVGASDDYARRFFEELPRTFSPQKFNPADWATLAKLAGIRYVVFTAKHHSGFCMWPTKTTDFSIAHTPFQRDIVGETLAAFRAQGIAPGLYFSPEDFSWLYRAKIPIERRRENVLPAQNPGLLALDQAQVKELLTNYGPIDVLFFDGPPNGLREEAWQLQPNIVVTRGALLTPEQNVPGAAIDAAWEACLTMGKAWQYQPTLENYKSGSDCISLLVEVRAKGGNLLLNVGPKPNGELAIEQEERLREIALWMFVNGECIYGVRPWVVTNEGDIWFTKRKDTDTVYAIVKGKERWKWGEWKDLVLKSVRMTPETEVSVLGQNDKSLEYQLNAVPKTTWEQKPDGLHIHAMRTQRLDDTRSWPNPVVLRLTHVQSAAPSVRVETVAARWNASDHKAVFSGQIKTSEDPGAMEAGFEYRDVTGLDTNEGANNWAKLPLKSPATVGEFSAETDQFVSGHTYEVRAFLHQSMLTLYGENLKLAVP
jgi:alpha-L-fucosidase